MIKNKAIHCCSFSNTEFLLNIVPGAYNCVVVNFLEFMILRSCSMLLFHSLQKTPGMQRFCFVVRTVNNVQ